MAVDINWGILTDASRGFANALTGAAGQIRERRETAKDRDAYSGYIGSPDDPAAFNALVRRNPQAALALRTQNESRTARRSVVGAAQRGDLAGAQTSALASGDADLVSLVRGLRSDQREHLRAAGDLLRDVRDDAGYQEALRAGHAAGMDIAGAPPAFDPAFVRQITRAADALAEPYNIGRGEIRRQGGRIIGYGGAPPSQIVAVPPGGRAEETIPEWPPRDMSQPLVAPSVVAPVAAQPAQATATAASFRSPVYDQLEAPLEAEYGIPRGLLASIRTRGEMSNADQVSEAGARTVYQVIPETRAAFLRQHGIDAYASPENAARVAALHLLESYQRTGSWDQAVAEYHGGTDRSQWGPRTRAYSERVGPVNQPQTAQIGGQTYYFVNGQWFDNPEGR